MPDITMCEGGECPRKEKCWRYTASPSPTGMQSYFVTPPYDEETDTCGRFWEDETVEETHGET